MDCSMPGFVVYSHKTREQESFDDINQALMLLWLVPFSERGRVTVKTPEGVLLAWKLISDNWKMKPRY
jgi:hypothetical protein